jgi:predicted CoA-binding protein
MERYYYKGVMFMKDIDVVKKEMLNLKKWAVIGATDDKSKYGYKILNKLRKKGYEVYGVSPKYDEIDGVKVYHSIKYVPEKVDCISMVVNPKIALDVLDDIAELGIKYVWFQPGTFDEDVLDKAKNLGLYIVYYECVYVDLG